MENKSLFGTSGIRGDAETIFTNQFSFDLGRAFAIFLKNHNENGWVAVGMDPRESSPRIKEALIKGLVCESREVYDEGITSIPSINWILKTESAFAGSVMVSGSHIKPKLNGMKFFAFQEEILKKHEKEIQEIYEKEAGRINFESILNANVNIENRARENYIEYLVSKINGQYPKWKIVVDCGNGAQSETIPVFLRRVGLEVIEINCSVQETFLSRDTEVSGDFIELQKKVIQEKADLGVGFDSDGDRVVFIDENGNFIPGDYSGALIAKHMTTLKVVTPINTSQVIDKIGKEVIRTKVGSPYVVGKMEELSIPFGFEANGGGIFDEMHSRDGGRTLVEFLNILKKDKNKVSELVNELPKFYLSRDKVDYKWELKDEILETAKEEFKGVKIEELDGLKIWIDHSTWILFRSSMNAPEFRVFAESDSREKSEKMLKDGIELVKKIISS